MSFTFNWDVIIAHGPGCTDGATAAWAVWRTLPETYIAQLEKIGGFYAPPSKQDPDDDEEIKEDSSEPYVHPNSPAGAIKLQKKGFPVVFVFVQPSVLVPEELVKDKRVLILDLDMGDALVPVVRAARTTMLCDHHDSTYNTLVKHSHVLMTECRHKFATFVNTAKSESGASLAWKLTHSVDIPVFVNIVRIGDTWQWHEMTQARVILEALYLRHTFRSFQSIEDTYKSWSTSAYIGEGEVVLRYKQTIVQGMAKKCNLAYIQTTDGLVFAVAYTSAGTMNSEVASAMKFHAEKRFRRQIDFCATWTYLAQDGRVQVSLRDPAPGLNLADIARKVDGPDVKGGGHPQAAGFTFEGIENFHQVFLKEYPNPVQLPPSPVMPNSSLVHLLQPLPKRPPSLPILTDIEDGKCRYQFKLGYMKDKYCGQLVKPGTLYCPDCHMRESVQMEAAKAVEQDVEDQYTVKLSETVNDEATTFSPVDWAATVERKVAKVSTLERRSSSELLLTAPEEGRCPYQFKCGTTRGQYCGAHLSPGSTFCALCRLMQPESPGFFQDKENDVIVTTTVDHLNKPSLREISPAVSDDAVTNNLKQSEAMPSVEYAEPSVEYAEPSVIGVMNDDTASVAPASD